MSEDQLRVAGAWAGRSSPKGWCSRCPAILSLWNCPAQCAAAAGFLSIQSCGTDRKLVAPVCTYRHRCLCLGGDVFDTVCGDAVKP